MTETGVRLAMALVVAAVATISQVNAAGWTYQPTASTCTGTNADPCGPQYWGNVPGDSLCYGTEQSPVDIVQTTFNPSLYGPSLYGSNGGCQTWVQFESNTTFELAFEGSEAYYCDHLYLTYEGSTYHMAQLHFHSPSEHTFGGGHYSAEVHMVHVNEDNEYLVLGALLQESADTILHNNNSFLQTLWNAGGNELLAGNPVYVNSTTPLNPYASFLPANRAQYVYTGSLTTPPCTQEIQWIVYQYPIAISVDDLTILRKLAGVLPGSSAMLYNGNSNRPSQPLNGRTIYWSFGEVEGSAIYAPYTDDGDDDNANKLAHTAVGLGAAGFTFGLMGCVLAIVICMGFKQQMASSAQVGTPTPSAPPATATVMATAGKEEVVTPMAAPTGIELSDIKPSKEADDQNV